MLTTSRLACLTLLYLALAPVQAQQGAPDGRWPSYGGDPGSTKYSPLSQIGRGNVQDLRIAWRWNSPDNPLTRKRPELQQFIYEATPLMADGRLYVSTSLSQVAALDPATGKTLWIHDPKSYESGLPPNLGFLSRGVAYWEDGDERRVFFATGDAHLIALDAATGRPVESFGQGGRIDLTLGLRRAAPRRLYGVTSPPIICRGVVIVGSSIRDLPEGPEMPPGDVRGFDARSGRLLWTFHSVPQQGEFGQESWENESWRTGGNTNVWSLMSADQELGLVYLPFGAASNDLYGGKRPGDNLFSESLVCLEARTGRRVWHYQIVHHGLWDYDLPAAPNLVDLTVEGRPVKAVAQVTKQGFCFVFDRVTGRPLWPIQEKPVPQSVLPGEKPSPTQPFPLKPPPFERQGLSEDDLIDFTPQLRRQALEILHQYHHGPLYTPPLQKPTVNLPGQNGGANWAGAALDPQTGILYVPSITTPYLMTLHKPGPEDGPLDYLSSPRYAPELRYLPNLKAPMLLQGPQGLPITRPPYSRVSAIDLNRGELLWTAPLGDGPRRHPALKPLNLPRLGSGGRGPALLTRTLLFVPEGISTERGVAKILGLPLPDCRGLQPESGWLDGFLAWLRDGDSSGDLCGNQPLLHAFDKGSGEEVAEFRLPSYPGGAPMTYMLDGKQYIVIAVGGLDEPSELVALSLP